MPRPALPAITASDQAPAVSARPVPPRIRHAIDLLVSGECKTQAAAAERVGLSRERLCRALKQDHIQAFVARETRRTIASAQMPAAATLVRLLDANSEHVAAQVAERLLAINGIKPDETSRVAVSVDVRAGYVIHLAESPNESNAG